MELQGIGSSCLGCGPPWTSRPRRPLQGSRLTWQRWGSGSCSCWHCGSGTCSCSCRRCASDSSWGCVIGSCCPCSWTCNMTSSIRASLWQTSRSSPIDNSNTEIFLLAQRRCPKRGHADSWGRHTCMQYKMSDRKTRNISAGRAFASHPIWPCKGMKHTCFQKSVSRSASCRLYIHQDLHFNQQQHSGTSRAMI